MKTINDETQNNENEPIEAVESQEDNYSHKWNTIAHRQISSMRKRRVRYTRGQVFRMILNAIKNQGAFREGDEKRIQDNIWLTICRYVAPKQPH